MLTNYIKVALAVLGRNRFFTFVSLFGISLTLAVLIIISAFLNQCLSPSYPNLNKDRVLMIRNVGVKEKMEVLSVLLVSTFMKIISKN